MLEKNSFIECMLQLMLSVYRVELFVGTFLEGEGSSMRLAYQVGETTVRAVPSLSPVRKTQGRIPSALTYT